MSDAETTTDDRCAMCGQLAAGNWYCTNEAGVMWPMCIDDGCGEHASGDDGRCRDCRIQHQLDSMECKTCKRMRYRADDAVGPLAGLGEYLWGERCECPKEDALNSKP